MRIAVIGKGNVGSTLGRKMADAGHDVVYGVRRPEAADERSVAEAAAAAEVVLLAVPWGAALDVVREAGELTGKLVLDCTNPLLPGLAGLEYGHTDSAAERLQAAAPAASVFKVFNTTGFNIMADPMLEGRRAMMAFCGDDDARRDVVRALVEEIGFEPVDAGPLEAARLLEPLALLWIKLAYQRGMGRDFAFAILRR